LVQEEPEWHKSVRKNHDPTKESVWVDRMVLDDRIAQRMRKFILDEDRISRMEGVKDAFEEER
jgi:import inner membrane translocase subunit TIM54